MTEAELPVRVAHLFDADWYRARTPTCDPEADPLEHYLATGWREGRDPSPGFDAAYYRSRYPAAARSGLPPLVHYALHGEAAGHRTRPVPRGRGAAANPAVSVVVPCYNHARFIRQRIVSILDQTWRADDPSRDMELIVLDDASTDDTLQVARAVLEEFDSPARVVASERNSGGVFGQWQRASQLARAPVMWLCESDDFAEPDLLSELMPAMDDPRTVLAFGRTELCDAAGTPLPGMDAWRAAAGGDWSVPDLREGADWFRGAAGMRNVISNVGACLMRRDALEHAPWDRIRAMSVCGDWLLYAHLASHGRFSYRPDAVGWFRQHGGNTSTSRFADARFYQEALRVRADVEALHEPPPETRGACMAWLHDQWRWFGMDRRVGAFEGLQRAERAAMKAAAPRQAAPSAASDRAEPVADAARWRRLADALQRSIAPLGSRGVEA